ncbi:transcriptional regulator [Streptococcus sp. zg-JUN1979]|uniref:transcriptional regulator n=1 Tax=Streptococcus sp. zg-JUN1979 TaxID=3391450 RepID=UPI0039A4744D
MIDTVETILLQSLYDFDGARYHERTDYLGAKRRKMIALLDEDLEGLEGMDDSLVEDYKTTIEYLESISDQDYETIKTELVWSCEQINAGASD